MYAEPEEVMQPLSRRLLSTGFVIAVSLRTAGLRPSPEQR